MMREQTMSSNDPTSNTEMSPKTKREREKGKIIELKSGTEEHVWADDEQKGIEGLHVHV